MLMMQFANVAICGIEEANVRMLKDGYPMQIPIKQFENPETVWLVYSETMEDLVRTIRESVPDVGDLLDKAYDTYVAERAIRDFAEKYQNEEDDDA